jgi:hypothetical protein
MPRILRYEVFTTFKFFLPELKASYTEEDNDLPPDEEDHYLPPDNYQGRIL